MKPIKTIGIVGCGAIAREILRAADDGRVTVRVAGVTSRTESTARTFLSTLRTPTPFLNMRELIEQSDMLVETAGTEVVPELAAAAFHAGKHLMIISIGALLSHPEIMDRSRETGCRLIMPSGAIVGLDAIKAASVGRIDHVRLVSRKPPAALQGAPYVLEHGIDVWALEEEREIFSGTAREACKGFPQNLNVSAAISFAGIGPDLTSVTIIAVPGLQRNCHDIEVEGEFGVMRLHLQNIPGENPKTGKLTAMSIIRTLQQAVDPVQIG